MKTVICDFLIIGGGVIGVNLAIQASRRYPDKNVCLIEKEADFGLHASGRNSGVLHAGFYYTADSLKAKFTRDGNKAMTEYCIEKGLKINRCGKLVVAQNESELASLDLLLDRANANGVELHDLTEKEAQQIEPRVKTYKRALSSPTTSSVDPKQVLRAMIEDAKSLDVKFYNHTQYLSPCDGGILTNNGRFSAGYVINAAGLYADKIANDYGFSKNYKVIPFKGLYLIGNEPDGAIKTNIYPVPDLSNPFLGVHFTLNVEGTVKLGPTAIPAFWREHYKGLSNFDAKEFLDVCSQELMFFITNNFGFRDIAIKEIAKYNRRHMVKLASALASDIKYENYTKRGAAGIRAQLYNIQKKNLEMDFVYEGDNRSFHILNAVSPAFTCCMPFTQHVFDEIEKYL